MKANNVIGYDKTLTFLPIIYNTQIINGHEESKESD